MERKECCFAVHVHVYCTCVNVFLSIQPLHAENVQNVRKCVFWQKALGVSGLKTVTDFDRTLIKCVDSNSPVC